MGRRPDLRAAHLLHEQPAVPEAGRDVGRPVAAAHRPLPPLTERQDGRVVQPLQRSRVDVERNPGQLPGLELQLGGERRLPGDLVRMSGGSRVTAWHDDADLLFASGWSKV